MKNLEMIDDYNKVKFILRDILLGKDIKPYKLISKYQMILSI